MTESTNTMRQIASCLSYDDMNKSVGAAKHMLLAAASELDALRVKSSDLSPAQATDKPPLGLMPKHVWEYRRILEIMRAIVRYEDAGISYDYEWHGELRELILKSDGSKGAAPIPQVPKQSDRFKGGVHTPHGGVSFHSDSDLARDYIWAAVREKFEREL